MMKRKTYRLDSHTCMHSLNHSKNWILDDTDVNGARQVCCCVVKNRKKWNISKKKYSCTVPIDKRIVYNIGCRELCCMDSIELFLVLYAVSSFFSLYCYFKRFDKRCLLCATFVPSGLLSLHCTSLHIKVYEAIDRTHCFLLLT